MQPLTSYPNAPMRLGVQAIPLTGNRTLVWADPSGTEIEIRANNLQFAPTANRTVTLPDGVASADETTSTDGTVLRLGVAAGNTYAVTFQTAAAATLGTVSAGGFLDVRWGASGAPAVLTAGPVADIYIPFWIGNYVAVSGTWAVERVGAADFRVRRTAAAALEVIEVILAPFRNRTTTGKGTKLTALRFKYSIGTADLDTNGVDVAVNYALMPATGNNVAAATALAGTWDADHDTAAKRKTQGEHTATFTFTSPVFFNTVVGTLSAVFSIDGSASGVFDLRQIIGLATEVEE